MEKYGDISVKKCDFIEVYPRFLVNNTKNLYKEKTGTRAGIWKKSENKKYYIIKKYCTSKRNTQRFGSAKWNWNIGRDSCSKR